MKIKVFGWLLLSDRLNTRNMLKRRHYNIGNDYDCILCGLHIEETLEHLFFECQFSTECWSSLGITWNQGQPRLQHGAIPDGRMEYLEGTQQQTFQGDDALKDFMVG